MFGCIRHIPFCLPANARFARPGRRLKPVVVVPNSHCIYSQGMDDVFQLLLPQILKPGRELITNLAISVFGKAYSTRLSDTF